MSNKLAKRAAEELVSLAVEIREEHEACEHDIRSAEHSGQSAVERAINCGRMLHEAKEKAGHGNWLPWLDANFPADARTAQSYMQLASNAQTSAHFKSIDSALKALAEPRQPEGDERPGKFASDEPSVAEMAELEDFEEVDAEVVEDDPQDRPPTQSPASGPAYSDPSDVQEAPDYVPRVRCPTCGHMVASDDIQTWKE